MIFGRDYLGCGSPHWDIKSTIASHPSTWFIGAFDGVWPQAFGDPSHNIRAIFSAHPDCPGARIHIWFSYSHAPVPMDILIKRLPHWENFAKITGKKIYISHSCEYGPISAQDLSARVAAIKKFAPSCIPVNTPEGGSITLPGVITERHGSNVNVGAGGIASTDGNSITDADAETYRKNNLDADICFLWSTLDNMAESHNTLPPNKRTAQMGVEYNRGVIALANPRGTCPIPSFAAVTLVKPNLWKPFAEDSQGSNPRDNKPMFWLENEAPDLISVVTHDEQVIATLGHFSDVRWYSGWKGGSNLTGYQIQQKALQVSGSPWVWFKTSKGKFYGGVNAAFRGNFYQ